MIFHSFLLVYQLTSRFSAGEPTVNAVKKTTLSPARPTGATPPNSVARDSLGEKGEMEGIQTE